MPQTQIHFVEQALTPSECRDKVFSKYGERAKIMVTRTVQKGGIFGFGSHEETEMSGVYDLPVYSGVPRPFVSGPAPEVSALKQNFNLEAEKQKVIAAAGRDPALQTVLKEVRDLHKKLDDQALSRAVQTDKDHPALARLKEDFAVNDFSPSYTQKMIDRARRELAIEDLDDYEKLQRRIVRWIGESISIYREESGDEGSRRKPRIIVFVGATGVGKTTTLAKLAFLYGELSDGSMKKEVRLVTIDNYRIGAKQQIETYGEIMRSPSSLATNYEELRSTIALYRRNVDFVLVDTIGKSPRNYGEIGEMKALLDACGPRAEIQLCVSAATKSSDITEIMRQFEPFKYKSVIVTKLDETSRVGNVISALSEASKSVSFITTGQGVPADIERASVMRFLLGLEGFSIDREEMEKYFSENVQKN